MKRFLGLVSMAVSTFLIAGCGAETPDPTTQVLVAAPLTDVDNGYERATRDKLPDRAPEESEGLHQVFKLSENIISGAEPEGEAAFKRIAEMGVKTILSVDGKTPDADTARKYGLRYVHVPIRYSGLSADQIGKIAKTFREQQGPFFVHCFHGKHRGPAGAAIGRMVLDGEGREQVLSEMAQWCGTAKKYEGLFQTIATANIPSSKETQTMSFGFDEAHPFHGLRSGMIALARTWDNLKLLQKNDWAAIADHPDLDSVNEVEMVKQSFARFMSAKELAKRPTDYQGWMRDSARDSVELHKALYELRAGKDGALEKTNTYFRSLAKDCAACHTSYRNANE